ncbi:M13 family peptidase, partial [Acinetobacter baumannii]
ACKNETHSNKKFIETGNIDSAIKPGDDFFVFVNGKWLDTAKIPATETGVGAFLDVYNQTKGRIKTILEDVSKGNQNAGSIEQKVGDFY